MYMQNLLTKCVKVAKSYQLTEHGIPHGFNEPHPTNTAHHLPSLVAIRKRRFEEDEELRTMPRNHDHCKKDRITIGHLIQALHTIKSQKIRVLNVERAQCLLKTDDVTHRHRDLNSATLHKIQNNSNVVTPASRTV